MSGVILMNQCASYYQDKNNFIDQFAHLVRLLKTQAKKSLGACSLDAIAHWHAKDSELFIDCV